MNHPTVRPLLVPLAASVAVHAAAAPFAAILARCACPLLDRTGFGGVGLAMFVAQLAACAGYWLMQGRWARLWRDAARGLPLADADVASLLGGAFRGVAQHVPACLAGTAAGAFVLRAAYGHDVFNVRFWYSSMLVAGFAVGVVEANGGHVDKFLGDGLMAWFDEAPGAADLGAPRAIAAAASLLRCLGEFDADLARRGVAPIRIGVGLHAGDVVRGNLGAGRRKQWTVIGDTVNLASRMESMTKTLGCDIALTSAVAAHLPPQSVKPLGDHEVRGQPKPVACYALRAG